MKGDGLKKLYDRLAPEERFRLVIEAEARGDEEESRRLVQSAPRYTYTDADLDYINRLRASQELTMAVCLDLAPPLARVRMVEGFSAALPLAYNACIKEAHFAYLDGREAGLKEGLGAAGTKGGFPDADQEGDNPDIEEALDRITHRIEGASKRFLRRLEELELEIAAEARVLWEAFSKFSREELGLEPKKLVKMWFEPALSEIEELERLTDGIELGREKVEDNEALLKSGWSKLVSGV
jgi:hypothetical protein